MGVSAAEAPDFIHCVGEASRVAFEFSPDPSPPLQNIGGCPALVVSAEPSGWDEDVIVLAIVFPACGVERVEGNRVI